MILLLLVLHHHSAAIGPELAGDAQECHGLLSKQVPEFSFAVVLSTVQMYRSSPDVNVYLPAHGTGLYLQSTGVAGDVTIPALHDRGQGDPGTDRALKILLEILREDCVDLVLLSPTEDDSHVCCRGRQGARAGHRGAKRVIAAAAGLSWHTDTDWLEGGPRVPWEHMVS